MAFQCPMLNVNNERRAAAVQEMIGNDSDDNTAFYNAFARAWKKATIAGHNEDSLFPMSESC